MYKSKYTLEFCYSLEEIFKNEYAIGENPDLTEFGGIVPKFLSDYWKTGIGSKLWAKIWNKNREHIAVILPEKTKDFSTSSKPFWRDFYAIFDETHLYYEKVISIFEQKENDLLKQIESSAENEVKFNDTPQNGGDFATDDHLTNISKTKTTSKVDGATAMERIDEIRRRFTDLYNDWANRFDRLFISSLNYDKEICEDENDD